MNKRIKKKKYNRLYSYRVHGKKYCSALGKYHGLHGYLCPGYSPNCYICLKKLLSANKGRREQ